MLLLLVAFALFASVSATPLPGVPMLDGISFNKTLTAFPFSVIKFDSGYPTGEKHAAWGRLGRELAEVNEVLVAEVRIKEYGDKENVVRHGVSQ